MVPVGQLAVHTRFIKSNHWAEEGQVVTQALVGVTEANVIGLAVHIVTHEEVAVLA
jgi:hypothetical protein